MKKIKKYWRSIKSASVLAQISLIVATYFGCYVVLFIAINQTTWGENEVLTLSERASKVTTFFFLDSSEAPEINQIWGLINKLVILLLTAFSSSLLTTKMISQQSNLRFSNPLAYYSRSIIDSEQSRFPKEYLVFRLLNEGIDDLYNVRISATLRYLDLNTSTFQHYTCVVTNGCIPVLASQMPFRIYIEMGEITSAIYKKKLSFNEADEDAISIAAIQSDISSNVRLADADELILYIEGIDSGEGRLTTSSHRYRLGLVREGKFQNIEPRSGCSKFDPNDIDRAFDRVLPLALE